MRRQARACSRSASCAWCPCCRLWVNCPPRRPSASPPETPPACASLIAASSNRAAPPISSSWTRPSIPASKIFVLIELEQRALPRPIGHPLPSLRTGEGEYLEVVSFVDEIQRHRALLEAFHIVRQNFPG